MLVKKLPGLRWYIVSLLCIASGLNYLDRQALSVLAQTIQNELHITTVQYAHITSAFLLSYTAMYAVSGWLVDRLGTRKSFLIFVSGWSVSCLLHAVARTALQFSFFRFLLGATEPANFPAGIKAVSEWFPMRERTLAVGIFNGGVAVGAAIAAPLISWIALMWGWQSAFVFGGVLGLIWVAAWAVLYRHPREHPWLGAEELKLIESGDSPSDRAAALPFRRLLRVRTVWGCVAARMLLDPCSYFFTFWIIKFLQQERGFDLVAVGKYSGIPFVALALGNVLGGAAPRILTGYGWSHNRARKTVMVAVSCLVPLCCLLIPRAASPLLAVGLISLAMFGHGAWGFMALPAEVLPKNVVGSVTGLAGALGGVMGILTQQLIGWTVQNVSFTPVFIGCACAYLAAFIAVSVLIGEIGKVNFPE
ncbi:MAG: MFS transporter [Opitutae bacterium]|nr:MFS transporter [Opitutae bacterium]